MMDKKQWSIEGLRLCRKMLLEVSCELGIIYDGMAGTQYQSGIKYVHGEVIEAEEAVMNLMNAMEGE